MARRRPDGRTRVLFAGQAALVDLDAVQARHDAWWERFVAETEAMVAADPTLVTTGELRPGQSIWNYGQQNPTMPEGDCLDILAVSDPDAEGMVTVVTTTGQFRYASDWGQQLYTDEDRVLVGTLMMSEQDKWLGGEQP